MPVKPGMWIVAKTPIDEPYPCRCVFKRDLPCRCTDPARVQMVIANGWPLCPCWGMPVHEKLPPGCCRHGMDGFLPPAPPPLDDGRYEHDPDCRTREIVMATSAGIQRIIVPAYLPAPDPEDETEEERHLAAQALERARRIVTENTCPCPTPWDGQKRAAGRHCPRCCRNFASDAASEMHRRSGDPWQECRDPALVIDVDRGTPLLARRPVDGGFLVWGFA